MDRKLSYVITEAWSGRTIYDFIKMRGFSHQILRNLKQTPGGIVKNGTEAFPYQKLEAGDCLQLFLREELQEKIKPVKLDFGIVYEDEDLLVVDKPADMPVHPSQNNHDNTLANACMWYFQQKQEPFVFRCISRLDRDTTGLLLIAKNIFSASLLTVQMEKRQIHRTYLAVVTGRLPENGIIDAPIARKEGSAIERCVDWKRGEKAVTHYECLEYRNGYSLARIWLETGRTHQIRVHMAHIGHPLPGDYLYNPGDTSASRQMLHSAGLQFVHPITGEHLVFESPLPEDMKRQINCTV